MKPTSGWLALDSLNLFDLWKALRSKRELDYSVHSPGSVGYANTRVQSPFNGS